MCPSYRNSIAYTLSTLQLIKQHNDKKAIHTHDTKNVDMCKLIPTIKTTNKEENRENDIYTRPLRNMQFNTEPQLERHFRDNADCDVENILVKIALLKMPQ